MDDMDLPVAMINDRQYRYFGVSCFCRGFLVVVVGILSDKWLHSPLSTTRHTFRAVSFRFSSISLMMIG